MSPPILEFRRNAARRDRKCDWAPPTLSVVIPFLRDDPRALIAALVGQAEDAPGETEIILIDDGAPDRALTDAVWLDVDAAPCPATLIISRRNLGRSAARNRLASEAIGGWVLFLDADMQVAPDFLKRWRALFDGASFDAAFGGFDLSEEDAARHRVHAALARAGDIAAACDRARTGASAVCASNLAARRAFLARARFDEAYVGWGWEDVDWAVRAARTGTLAHVDNPARHGGLEDIDALIAKFAAGGRNHARLLKTTPEMRARPAGRMALWLNRLQLSSPVGALGRGAARFERLPLRLRVLGLKLHRAAACAEHL